MENNICDKLKVEFLSYVNNCIDNLQITNQTLKSSIKYSLQAGGKRIRPVLMLLVNEILGGNFKKVLPFSFAVECVHTYSLIHDDLPSLDNDDFRRGKPTNHKVYGEAMAILAGDSLLNLAYEICFENAKDSNSIKAGQYLAISAGSLGMINGQAFDIQADSIATKNEDLLNTIHLNKTAKLITAPIVMASLLNDSKYLNVLKTYGLNLGYLFQYTDDILDVTSTPDVLGKSTLKDIDQNKLTAVSCFGMQVAKQKCQEFYFNCVNALNQIPNSESLKQLTEDIYRRLK